MWVRSQDKKTIIKVESINYHAVKEQITEEMKNKKGKTVYVAERPVKIITQEIMHHYIYINQYKFAKYSTEEKALKVLDEIHNLIDLDAVNGVYQLPQDEEIE